MFDWLPINWFIVALMVLIAGIALEVVIQAAQGNSLDFGVNLPGLPSQAGAQT